MPIFKFFIITILFFIKLDAESFKENVFESIYTSTDGKIFKNNKKLDKKYFEKKYTKFIFKLNINKKILEDNIFYLKINCNLEDFVSTNVPYTLQNNYPIIKLDKNIQQTIILNFDYKNKVPFLELQTFNQFEYKYIFQEEKTLFGITYGIVLCAFLYNFIFFIYNKEKSFLFYSLLQIFLMLILIVNSKELFLFNLFEGYGKTIGFLVDIIINLIISFSILFNMTFLNTKKFIPKVHKFLLYILYLNIIDLVLLIAFERCFIFEYIPMYVIILILLFSAFKVLNKGYKPAIFYIVGWVSLFIVIFLLETSFSDYNKLYLLHIGIPLESLLFSFALGFKIKQIEWERQRNETILINQSKLASMGEMIGNIAHQWRQPLTNLSYIIMNLKAAYEKDKLDKYYLEKKTEEANDQINFMSHTIEDFKNFFKVSKQKEKFSLVSSINESFSLLKESFKALDIKFQFNYKNDITIYSYKGELSQVIFNLLNNAKDELIRKQINLPKILVELIKKDKNIIIKISDNAGGINENIVKKIFEPYFTTKDKGLGIGLYMSKIIIEKNIHGRLEVKNTEEGAEFSIHLPDKF
jgi:signal transduction histidine kinase